MRTLLSVLAWGTILSFLSCTTVANRQKTFDYDYLFITKQGIIQRPLLADLEVAKQRQVITRSYKNATVSTARQNIVEEFVRQFQCDLIVQPYFSTQSETVNGKTNVDVTLNAYPAHYRNLRNYEPKDKELLLPEGYKYNPNDYPKIQVSQSQSVMDGSKKKMLQQLTGN